MEQKQQHRFFSAMLEHRSKLFCCKINTVTNGEKNLRNSVQSAPFKCNPKTIKYRGTKMALERAPTSV